MIREEKIMSQESELKEFLQKHLQSILENDLDVYHETTHENLTLYEWFVTPHRIDGLPFHDFMMENNRKRGAVFGSEVGGEFIGEKPDTRFDLANLEIQQFGDTAIASYTMMVSTGLPTGVQVVTHNETRVIIKIEGIWKVVHVHKSPAWKAPHVQP
jgi:hypothetical protein